MGLSGATSTIFYADVYDADIIPGGGGGNPDEGEVIEVVYWSVDRADDLLKNAECTPISATAMLAVLWFMRHVYPTLLK